MRSLIFLCALIVATMACTDIRCEVNSDCGERARCTMNRCVSSCRQDRDCEDGRVCSINGECVAPPSSTTDAQVGDDRALADVATMPDAPGVDSAPMDTPIEASFAPDGATDVGDDGVGDAPIEEASHAEVGADVGMDSPSEDADDAGYEDCDGIASNGCEASLTLTANCGSCGRVCSATAPALPACVAAACDFTCPAGYGRASGGCTCWRPTMSTTITGSGYFQQTDYARITGCAIDRPFNYTYSMTTMTRAIEVTTDGTIMVETRPFGDCQYHPARDSIPTRVVVSSICGGSFSVSGLPTSGGGFDCTRTNDYSLSIQITGGRIRIVDTCVTHYARGDTGRYEAFFDAPAPVIP